MTRSLIGPMLIILIASTGCSGGGSNDNSGTAPAPIEPPVTPQPPTPVAIEFYCAKDPSCPEIVIDGDPFAEFSDAPAPFRGYGDPSLAYDQESSTLWLSYSWLDLAVVEFGPPPQPDFLVRTHLARSTDMGATFEYIRDINRAELINHPDNGQQGWLIHEVSTIAQQTDNSWQILWLQYFDPVGEQPRYEFQYNRSNASMPTALGDVIEPWIRTSGTSASFGAATRLAAITELSDCIAFTEPNIFSHAGTNYLATTCLVFADGERRTESERLVLLRESAEGYEFIGELLDSTDAAELGGDVVQQADIALARDGTILLLVTPIKLLEDPQHKGCIALQINDMDTASVARNESGSLLRRATITADGNGLGPGLCTYNANSDTGVMIVITTVSADPVDIEFSLRSTGVHP